MGSEKGDAEDGFRKGRCRKWIQERSVPKLGSERVVPKIGSGKVDAENGLRKGWCRKYDQERSMPKMGSEKGGAVKYSLR